MSGTIAAPGRTCCIFAANCSQPPPPRGGGRKSSKITKPPFFMYAPSAAASAYVTEHRWPVTFSPRRCASSIAAPSSSRVICMYALNDVAPMSAQYAT